MGEASRAADPYRVCEARCFAAARVGPSAEEIWTHRAGARRCALTRRGARGVACGLCGSRSRVRSEKMKITPEH